MGPNSHLNEAMEAAHHIADPAPPWEGILASAARLVGADSGTLIHFDGDSELVGVTSFGHGEDTARDYTGYFCNIDIVAERAKQSGAGTWVDTNAMMSSQALHCTEYYADFMRKHGMAQSFVLPLVELPSLRVGLGFQRSTILHDAGRKLGSGATGQYFRFLQDAFLERRRSFDVHVQTLEATFAGLGDALCLVGANGSVLRVSALAGALLAEGPGLAVRRGKLWHSEPQVLQYVLRAISAVACGGIRTRVHVPGGWGHVLSIDIAMAPPRLRLTSETALLLRLQKNSAFTEANANQLASFFHLTIAESRVLAALANGHAAADYAAMNGVSLNTVKNQIRALMEKMQCSRQVELVKLALLLKS